MRKLFGKKDDGWREPEKDPALAAAEAEAAARMAEAEPDWEPPGPELGPDGAPDAGEASADVPEDAPEDPDYYDWKARYDPWPGIGMMAPVLVSAGLLAVGVLVLLCFVFHPIW